MKMVMDTDVVVAAWRSPTLVAGLDSSQLRDPGDELVLEAAVNASAHTLLTFNLKHFVGVTRRFDLHVSPPGPFLRSLP